MKVITSYLLAVLGGNASPSADDIKNILASVGTDADEERIEMLLSQVKGKDITELIAVGRENLATVPAGGGMAVATTPAGGGTAPAAAPETKREEKVEEKEESDDIWFPVCSTKMLAKVASV